MSDTSIIIPVYCKNQEELSWLDECIDSVIDQGQIVMVDDGSPVHVDEKRFPLSDNFLFFRTTNRGPASARNLAVSHADGTYIFPVDADDLLVGKAIERLEGLWTGVPIYPDLYKFGVKSDPHYRLMDWRGNIFDKVGIASVCVFHSVKQWREIGGWNETTPYYEDGEYCAKLFIRFCAVHLHEPLVGYRTHGGQRSRKIAHAHKHGIRVLRLIEEYHRRLGDMACPGCGKRRTPSKSLRPAMQTVRMTSTSVGSSPPSVASELRGLPGSTGNLVLAMYVGGSGRGTHYYRGRATGHAYKVRNGDIISADPRDCREAHDDPNRSLLVRTPVEEQPKPAVEISKVDVAKEEVAKEEVAVAEEQPKPARKPRKKVTKDPVK